MLFSKNATLSLGVGGVLRRGSARQEESEERQMPRVLIAF